MNNTYAISSRCIGSNPADPDWDTNINEAGYYTREQAISQGKYFNYMNEHYGTFKNEDGQYDTDWTQIQKIEGARIASDNYWIASRLLDLRSDSSRLYIRYTNTYGNLSYYEMCYVFSSTIERSNIYSSGLRPVLTLKSDIKIIDGDGNTIPYTLAP